ncbi:unnamed protein product [Closterium sp. NIES-53]
MAEMALLLEELQAHPQDMSCFVEEAILPTKLPFRISGDGRLDPRPDWHLNIGFLFNAAGTVMCPPVVMFRLEDELAQGIENPAGHPIFVRHTIDGTVTPDVLQRFGFTYSSPQSTPLPTGHSLSAPPSDESVEPSGPYPELMGCLMYLMTCTRPGLAYPLSLLARYVAPVHLAWGSRLEDGLELSSLGTLTPPGSSCKAEIYAGAMAAQELRWLTYLLTDLGEAPRLEHRTKHIALRYFLARELQQRGQLYLAYVASQANTADVFTKALQPCDHQRFCTVLCGDFVIHPELALPFLTGLTQPSARTPVSSIFFRLSQRAQYDFDVSSKQRKVKNEPRAERRVQAAASGVTVSGSATPPPPDDVVSHVRNPTYQRDFQTLALYGPHGVGCQLTAQDALTLTDGECLADTVVDFHNMGHYSLMIAMNLAGMVSGKISETVEDNVQLVHYDSESLHTKKPEVMEGVKKMLLMLHTAQIPTADRKQATNSLDHAEITIMDVSTAYMLMELCAFWFVTDPSLASTAASALVAELVDFAASCRLDYAASLVAESASVCPPSVGGECALSTDVLEDRQEEFQCFAAALPHLVSTLLAPEGDLDAPDIPTPRSYAEAIECPYSSQWQAAMDAEMASWKSTCTYVDEVPPPGANIVSGMWIFRVKRPPGSPPVFKARYVARGFSQRQGVDYFQTFSPTPKMTTLRVLLHVAAQRDYKLHSLDFSTAFLHGSLHEEIWLCRPPGFTGTTLAALGFAPSTADPSLFLRTDTSLLPFYVLMYVDDLVFATADTAGLAHVKSELQKRHTCTDLACFALLDWSCDPLFSPTLPMGFIHSCFFTKRWMTFYGKKSHTYRRQLREEVSLHTTGDLVVRLFGEGVEVPLQPLPQLGEFGALVFPKEDEVRTDLARQSGMVTRMELGGYVVCAAVTSLAHACGISEEQLLSGISRLRTLQEFYIYACDAVQELPESVTGTSLRRLEMLRVVKCTARLTRMPMNLEGLVRLKRLKIKGRSRLQGIPTNLPHLLECLSLPINQQHASPFSPFSMLYGSCTFSRLRCWKSCLEALLCFSTSHYLEIHAPKLASLPDGIGSLSRLRTLDLSECTALVHLPASLTQLACLNSLHLTGCCIRFLPPDFEKLTRLRILDLDNCEQLEALPEGMTQLKALRWLSVEGSRR